MTAVLDTNVLVSALLNPYGTPSSILNLIIKEKIILAYDVRILCEYEEVLHRPRFDFSPPASVKSDGPESSHLRSS
ncbi:MAG: putative toxin-antitoxin system toxin component, PIN family [Chitinispirillaceae bacterium]|nr:putative toxin-antitoxin system toxin component, PIN family [Chitinispirillaceae bacterium]